MARANRYDLPNRVWGRVVQSLLACVVASLLSTSLHAAQVEPPEVVTPAELVRPYRVGMLNFNLLVMLAYAAGMDLEVIKDTPREYEILLNKSHIVATQRADGIDIRLQAEDMGAGTTLLNTLMGCAEEMEASSPTLHLHGEAYEKKKALINQMFEKIKSDCLKSRSADQC